MKKPFQNGRVFLCVYFFKINFFFLSNCKVVVYVVCM